MPAALIASMAPAQDLSKFIMGRGRAHEAPPLPDCLEQLMAGGSQELDS